MMGWYGAGMGAGGWVFMGLFWVVLVGAIVWLVVALARAGRGDERRGSYQVPPTAFGPGAGPSSLEVLDRRLAAGEIDLATYQQARVALGEAGGAR